MASYSKEQLYNALLCRVNQHDRFPGANGVTVTKVSENYAEGVLKITPQTWNYRKIVHGGALAMLADTVAGVAAGTAGRAVVTVNYMLNFLKQVTGESVRCEARPDKLGKTISVFRIELFNEQEQLCASGSFTFFHLEEFGPDNLPLPD